MKKSLQFSPSYPSPSRKQTTPFTSFHLPEQEPHLSNKINFSLRKHQTSPFNPNEALNFSTAPTELEYRQTNKQTKAFFPPKQSISLAAQFFMCCARKRVRSEESNQTALLKKRSKPNKDCGPRAPNPYY
jgi:hypothetical protein